MIECFGWVEGVDSVHFRIEKSKGIFVIPLLPAKRGQSVLIVVFKEADDVDTRVGWICWTGDQRNPVPDGSPLRGIFTYITIVCYVKCELVVEGVN